MKAFAYFLKQFYYITLSIKRTNFASEKMIQTRQYDNKFFATKALLFVERIFIYCQYNYDSSTGYGGLNIIFKAEGNFNMTEKKMSAATNFPKKSSVNVKQK